MKLGLSWDVDGVFFKFSRLILTLSTSIQNGIFTSLFYKERVMREAKPVNDEEGGKGWKGYMNARDTEFGRILNFFEIFKKFQKF